MPLPRRIVPLVVLVSAVHGALLQVRTDVVVAPGTRGTVSFATRQVVMPEPVPVPPPPPRMSPPAAAASPVPVAPQPQAAPAATAAEPRPASPPRTAPPSGTQHASLEPATPQPAAVTGVPPHRLAIPPPLKMHYDVQVTVRGIPVNGRSTLHWQHDGSQYDARMEVTGTLLPTRVQTSSGVVTREGLQPLRFSHKSRSVEAAHFDRDAGKVTFSANRPAADLLAGAQDRLSIVLQLAAIVGGNPAGYPTGTSIAIPTVGTRESDTWLFSVEGEEDLELPAGRLRGLKLQRLPRKAYDTQVELWLAPGLDYAPVRLRLTYANGDSLDQRWSSADKG